MNNSFYGKTVENVRKYQDIKLINNDEKRVIKYQSKPNFVNTVSFTDTLQAVKMEKKTINFNKPTYVGIAVLELSKLTMYEFYYNCLKNKYGDNLELILMDTDSFFLCIKTEDFWEDVKNDPELYKYIDFSNLPKEHPLHGYYIDNNGKIGKFKNELAKKKKVIDQLGNKVLKNIYCEMDVLISVKPKVYSYMSEFHCKMTNKGSMKVVMKYDVNHQDYEECIFENHKNYLNWCNYLDYKNTNELNKYITTQRIGSDKLDVFVYENKKVALSCFDDKNYIDPKDGITVYPHGYFNN